MPGTNDGYDSQYACPSSLSDSPGLRHRIAAWHLSALRLHTSLQYRLYPNPKYWQRHIVSEFQIRQAYIHGTGSRPVAL